MHRTWTGDVSHMIIIYMFQCYSLKSSHPHLLPQSPKVCSLHLCLFCCLAYRVIITIKKRNSKLEKWQAGVCNLKIGLGGLNKEGTVHISLDAVFMPGESHGQRSLVGCNPQSQTQLTPLGTHSSLALYSGQWCS